MKDETRDRAKGKLEEMGGKIQEGVGRAVGDDRAAAKGRTRQVKGQVRQEEAKARGRVRGTAQQVSGKVKKGIGKVTDDESLEAEGRIEDLEGEARRKANRSVTRG